MTMNDFAKIIKQSHIVANDKPEIIFQLLQALGAGEAMGEAAKGQENRVSGRSPTESGIKKWLRGEVKPDTIRYFPNLKVEDENRAHAFFRKPLREERWIELRDLFREWYDNQNIDGYFCINTETDDLIEFSTSFWRQFVSFFPTLRMWDDEMEPYPEKESNEESSKEKIANEMLDVFKEKYMQYKVYEFIPKEINSIIDSLYIYHDILNEQARLNEGTASDCDIVTKFKKMYCKWFPKFDYFVFHEGICLGDYWELKLSEKYMLLKFDKDFDYEIMPINTWLRASFKFTFADPRIINAPQFNDEVLPWKECKGEIIIVEIDSPIDYDSLGDKGYPIIKDCYEFIDGMLALEPFIDEFIIAVNEKIIEKYEDIMLDDNSKLLYNAIKQYRRLLKKFKKNLAKFRNLPKVKDEYLGDRALKETFGMYSSFSHFEVSPKPHFPSSEWYLDQSEADKIKSSLCRCHESLMELYTEIFSHRESCIL